MSEHPMPPEPDSGAAALALWKETTGATVTEIARGIRKSEAAVYGYLQGKYVPEAVVQARIEHFTNGVVSRDAWLTAEQRAAIAAVKPYAGKAA